MSEIIYRQVENAIASRLHLGGPPKPSSIYNMHWWRPVAIDLGDVVLRDSSLSHLEYRLTVGEWADRVRQYGLWKMVGMWSFVPADDPAAGVVAMCERYPQSAGHELYDLRQERDKLRAEVERLRGALETIEIMLPESDDLNSAQEVASAALEMKP
jgi:hypothetical protein